ncbi:MAG: NAD(P)/FAD-dependent oxidoreductase [Acidimicrobiia bacterium]
MAVVGGGPAGLMAAEVLASAGLAVTVYERMPSVGRKLQLAGRGGLNLTHTEPLDRLLDRYGPARHRLAPAIAAFGPDDLRAWCAGLGQPTFVGTSGRVFPVGFRSTALLRAWLARLAELGVVVRTRHAWRGWDDDGRLLVAAGDHDPVALPADAAVLALGGASWPRVGSDGSWVAPVRAAGIEVVLLRPANCGLTVAWTETFRTRFEGQPLKDVGLAHDGAVARGDVVVTRTGIEGGPVYALSGRLRDRLEEGGPAVLVADLRPDRTVDELAARLARGRPGDSVANRLRRAGLGGVAGGLLREAAGPRLPADPAALAGLVKAVPIRVDATQPLDRAISTAGGIRLDELDDRSMLRRRPGTFVAGEMLDWEAPTGGYLLQASFSTGVAAARGVLAWLAARP